MYFHLPPSVLWNAHALCAELIHRQIEATVKEGEVHLSLPSDYCEARNKYYAKRSERRGRPSPGKSIPHVYIRYLPNRFMRNLELHLDRHMTPASSPIGPAVDSICQMGATHLDSIGTEVEIARRRCSDHAAITEFRLEIERLVYLKLRYVEELDFHRATAIRDAEDECRDKFDNLLFHGQWPPSANQ